jgi:Anti-sigma factor NepR
MAPLVRRHYTRPFKSASDTNASAQAVNARECSTAARVTMLFRARDAARPTRARALQTWNTEHGWALVGMARDLAVANLNAVRTGIGAELRKFYSDVLREEIPDKMAEQLDQLTDASPGCQDADDP